MWLVRIGSSVGTMKHSFSTMAFVSELIPYGREGLEVLGSDTDEGQVMREAFVKKNEKFLPGCTDAWVKKGALAALKTCGPMIDATVVVDGSAD